MSISLMRQEHTQPLLSAVNGMQPKTSASVSACCKFLLLWIKLCGYSGNKSNSKYVDKIYAAFVALLVLTGAVYQCWTIQKTYYQVESVAYMIALMFIYVTLYRNIHKPQVYHLLSTTRTRDGEFYAVFMLTLCSIIILNIAPYPMDSHLCRTDWQDITSGVAALFVNLPTMYTLNIVVLFLSLRIIAKYNTLTTKLRDTMTILNAAEIRDELIDIQNDIQLFRRNWERVVSVSCAYHFSYGVVFGWAWLLRGQTELYAQCDSRTEWLSMVLVMSTICVRLLSLFWGILRLNTTPQRLAVTLNDYFLHHHWSDTTQQVQIQRMIESQTRFQESFNFKVIGVALRWKHFMGIIASVVITAFGSMLRSKLFGT